MPSTSRLFHNWRLKLSALGLSLFLWAVVQAEPSNRETFSSVPVRVEIADTSWLLAAPPNPSSVEIRMGGVAREMIRLAREGTMLRVPVTSVSSRDTVITVRREWVEAASRPGVTVESVTPPVISFSFEPALSRLVPVAPRLQGQVPDGMAMVGEVATNPQFVRVRGPESRIAGLDSIGLQGFDLSTVRRPGVYTVAVDTAGLLGATAQPATVSLSIRVEELVERTLAPVPVIVDAGEGQPELVASPAQLQVRIVGPRSVVTALDLPGVEVEVAPELLADMAVGEVRRVPVRVLGVPEGMRAQPLEDAVSVRRAADVGPSPRGASR